MKNKIYIICFNNIDYSGGLENVLKNHITNFSENTKKLITVISRGRSHTLENLNVRQEIIFSRENKLIDKIFFINQIIFSFKVSLFTLKNIKKYRNIIIHVHGLEYSAFLILINIFSKKCNLIITAHGSLFLERLNYIKNKSIYLLVLSPILLPSLIYDSIASMGASKFICINKSIKNYFKIMNPRKNMQIIYNGMDFINKPSHTLKMGEKKQKLYKAIIVGSSTITKGLPLTLKIIDYFNRMNNDKKIKLYIVGFKDFYKYNLDKSISEKYFKYIGPIDQKEVFSLYKKMDFMILPSLYEGFPLTVLESLNFRLPFIVSKECKTKEISNYYNYGIVVDTREYKVWLQKVSYLINNISQYRYNLSKANFDNFKWDQVSHENESLYKKILYKEL